MQNLDIPEQAGSAAAPPGREAVWRAFDPRGTLRGSEPDRYDALERLGRKHLRALSRLYTAVAALDPRAVHIVPDGAPGVSYHDASAVDPTRYLCHKFRVSFPNASGPVQCALMTAQSMPGTGIGSYVYFEDGPKGMTHRERLNLGMDKGVQAKSSKTLARRFAAVLRRAAGIPAPAPATRPALTLLPGGG